MDNETLLSSAAVVTVAAMVRMVGRLVVWRRPPALGQAVDGQQRTPTTSQAAGAQPRVLPMVV